MRPLALILSTLHTYIALSGLTGCSPSGSGALSLPGLGFNFGRDDGPSGGNESDKADPPQQVAGAYLTCAYLDSKADVGQSATNGTPIPLGCGLFKRGVKSAQPASLANLKTSAVVSCSKKPLRTFQTTSSPVANLPLGVSIKPGELACTLQISIRDKLGKSAIYAKSLPTVTRSDALLQGFDADEDMDEQRIVLVTDPTTSDGAAASGIKTSAENSTLANWLADFVGGQIGADIAQANNRNFNGGPILGLPTNPKFIPNLSSSSFNSSGVYQGAGSGSGSGSGSGGSGGAGANNTSSSPSSKLPEDAQALNKNQQANNKQKNTDQVCTKKQADAEKSGQISTSTESSPGNTANNPPPDENQVKCKVAPTPIPGNTSTTNSSEAKP